MPMRRRGSYHASRYPAGIFPPCPTSFRKHAIVLIGVDLPAKLPLQARVAPLRPAPHATIAGAAAAPRECVDLDFVVGLAEDGDFGFDFVPSRRNFAFDSRNLSALAFYLHCTVVFH